MRRVLVIALAAVATPALAQGQPATQPAPQAQVATQAPGTPAARSAPLGTLPPQLSDPRFTDRLVDVMQAMSKAFLDMPVGEVQAAMEGRKPTRADRRRTVRSDTRISERELRQQIEASRPALQAGMKAMVAALPAMMKGMTEAAREMEKATANLPSPTYPNR